MSFIIYDWVCSKGNTTGVIGGAGIARPSGEPSSYLVFSRIRVAQFVVL